MSFQPFEVFAGPSRHGRDIRRVFVQGLRVLLSDVDVGMRLSEGDFISYATVTIFG